MKNIRVAFMGTPQIAATLLENIIQSKIEEGENRYWYSMK